MHVQDQQLRVLLGAYIARDEAAFEAVHDMAMDDPERCWRFIELAREADLSEEQLAYISAGPLEELLGLHGDRLIERVEAAARQDSKMRFLIATVWRGGMGNEVWARIEALRAHLAIKPL